MNYNLIIIILLCMFLAFFIILSFMNSKFKNLIKTKKEELEVIYIIASIFTIFSVIYGVYTFNSEQEKQREIQEQNKKIILELAKSEIDLDLQIISILEQKEIVYKNTTEIPIFRFEYLYLEKSIDIIKDEELRKDIFVAVKTMKTSNTLMDYFFGVLYPSSEIEVQIYLKLKKEAIGTLVAKNKEIEKLLNRIKIDLNNKSL